MNLHNIVRGAITTVNPDLIAAYYVSQPFTVDASFKQVPGYAAGVNVPVQVQALKANDLKHSDLVNIEGLKRAVYMYGNTVGVDRSNLKGGDLLWFPQATGLPSELWKVVCVLETWPDWSKVAVVLQRDAAPPSPPP